MLGGDDLECDFLERRPRHANEALAVRRGQHIALAGSGDVALHEHVAVVCQDRRRASAATAELGEGSVFTNDFLNFHLFLGWGSVNQNHAFWFIRPKGGRCV